MSKGQVIPPLTSLIQAGHANLEHAEELKLRIKILVMILVDELKGKKMDEIQKKLRGDVKSLEKYVCLRCSLFFRLSGNTLCLNASSFVVT